MKILLNYLKPHKWLVTLILFLAAINMSFSLMDPILLGKLVNLAADNVTQGFDSDKFFFGNDHITRNDKPYWQLGVVYIVLLSISVAMVSRIAKAFQDYTLTLLIQKFGAKMFTDGLKHAMKLPYQEFEDQRSGETLSILTKVRADVERFMISFINILYGVLIGTIFVFFYAAMFINWRIPIIYLGGIFLLTIVTNFLSKKIKAIQKNIVKETTALAGSTTESLRNIELVKSLGLTNQEVDRLNNNTYKILGLELKKVKRVRSISFIQGTMVNTLRQIIVFVLMWLIFHDEMDAGQLVTMQIFSFFIFGPLQEIGNILLAYREAEASLNNFQQLMQKAPEATPAHPKKIGIIENLTFQNVTFQHKNVEHLAIDRISFNVKKGETIAFVGPSGSGKSTLMKLLVGLYRPKDGSILYNGIDEDEFDYNELREQIGFVTQDTNLFSGTIRENLMFVNPQATDTDMMEALRKAACIPLLEKAENGLNTVIGEGGLKLSGGEKQRLSIARALLRKPHLLIFDEATSALDSITEEEITNTIRNISEEKNQITILIAHRLSTIMHADRIYVLEFGEIAETGTHQELINAKGLYYAMWRQQIGERRNAQKNTVEVN